MGSLLSSDDSNADKNIGHHVDEFESRITQGENQTIVLIYEGITALRRDGTGAGNTDPVGRISEQELKTNVEILFFKSTLLPQFAEALIAHKVFTSLAVFRQFVVSCARMTPEKSLLTMWDILLPVHVTADSLSADVTSPSACDSFFRLLVDFAYNVHTQPSDYKSLLQTQPTIDALLDSLNRFARSKSGTTSAPTFEDVWAWSNSYAPYLPRIVETFMHDLVFRTSPASAGFVPFKAPKLLQPSSIITDSSALLPLALYHANFQGNWARLYTTDADGTSFNRIWFSMQGYEGPTVILIKTRSANRNGSNIASRVFGGYASDKWKDSNRFFGTNNDFIFTLQPQLKIMRSRGSSNGNYRYLNTNTYNFKHGFGFGGSLDAPRLFIPESLEECVARNACLTYDPGNLIENQHNGQFTFEIDALEVWGIGGDKMVATALKTRVDNRALVDKNLERARKVDKAAFFDNQFDSEFLLKGTLQHRDRQRGDV